MWKDSDAQTMDSVANCQCTGQLPQVEPIPGVGDFEALKAELAEESTETQELAEEGEDAEAK